KAVTVLLEATEYSDPGSEYKPRHYWPYERANTFYLRGYARFKLWQAAPWPRRQATSLDDAQTDFNLCKKMDSDNSHRATQALTLIEKSRRPVSDRTFLEKWVPYLLVLASIGVIIGGLHLFWTGRPVVVSNPVVLNAESFRKLGESLPGIVGNNVEQAN